VTTPRVYATFEVGDLGPLLETEEGGFVVYATGAGLSLNRQARANITKTEEGTGYFECIFYGEESLTGRVSVGIVRTSGSPAPSLNVYVGGDDDSIGYRAGDGQIHVNGSSVASVATADVQDVIGIALFGGGSPSPTVAFYINGLLIHERTLPAGEWVPAVTVTSEDAAGIKAFVNFGKRAFEQSLPEGVDDGWYDDAYAIGTIRVASEDFITRTTDTPANTVYRGDIKNASTFFFEAGARVWPWGDQDSSASYGELELDNRSGRYDILLTEAPRDAVVTVRMLEVGRPLSEAVTVATAHLDEIDVDGIDTIRLRLKDPMAALDRPLQRKLFLPYVDESAANRPWPIALGAVRNIEPVLYDAENLRYAAHDSPLTQVDGVRDKGDPLTREGSPYDYTLTPDLRGIELASPPDGVITMDVSSQGNTEVVAPTSDDPFEGYGTFDVADVSSPSSGIPNGWLKAVENFLDVSWVSPGQLQFHAEYPGGTLEYEGQVLYPDYTESLRAYAFVKGVRYRVDFEVTEAFPEGTPDFDFIIQCIESAPYFADEQTLFRVNNSYLGPGAYSFTFVAQHDGWASIYLTDDWSTDRDVNGFTDPPWTLRLDNVVGETLTYLPTDVLEGYGNFTVNTTGTRWTKTEVGASFGFSPITTHRRIAAVIPSGAGNRVDYEYTHSDPIEAGKRYRLAWFQDATTATFRARWYLVPAGSPNTPVLLGSATGETRGSEILFTADVDGTIMVRMDSATAGAVTGLIAYIRCFDITLQDIDEGEDTPLIGISLTDYFREIIEERGGESSETWSSADTELIDEEAGYTFGAYFREPVTILDALRAPLDSFTAALFTDREGTLRVARLVDPAVGEGSPTPAIALEITTGNLLDPPDAAFETAKGLTSVIGYRRNWYVFRDADFVADYDDVPAEVRARFKRLSQYLLTGGDLHPAYRHAEIAAPLPSLLEIREEAQAEIDRVVDLYDDSPRIVYRFRVAVDGAPPDIHFGSIVHATYPRFGLTAGKYLFVESCRVIPFQQELEIFAWG
jgi:hypothetical protein